ncbi:MAG: SDR family NAD(P)-dependent oxidoreductase, partial [Kiritimatiellaeota bacterium]|nr:SDR family NAD(P)-dependent oxidoreductase [Kiritimatiellota bacterium]
TGAAGFIGGYVVNQFAAEGWHVLVLVHRTTSAALARLAQAGSVTIIRGDVTDLAALHAQLSAALAQRQATLDAVVHCAGRASDVGWRCEFRRTNFESLQGLVRLVKELNVGRFVFVSTTDVYGLRDFKGEAEEELPLQARPRNPYPEFKIAAEQHIRAELPPERYSLVRPAQVWGLGDPTLTARIVDFLKWSPWIVHFGQWRGRNRWPLAHVRNVALLTYLATIAPAAAGQAINILDDETTSMDEFYRILAKIFLPQKQFKTVTLPFWLGQCIGAVVSGLSNALNLNRPSTPSTPSATTSTSATAR